MSKRTPKKITDYFMAPTAKRKRVEAPSTQGKSTKKYIYLVFIYN